MTPFWGWMERALVAISLLFIITAQVFLSSRVLENAPAETTEPFNAVFLLVGLFVIYLLISAVLGCASSLVSTSDWLSAENNRIVDHVLSGVGAAVLAYHVFSMEFTFTAYPGLGDAVIMWGALLVAKFAFNSIPFWYIDERWDPVGSVRGVVSR